MAVLLVLPPAANEVEWPAARLEAPEPPAPRLIEVVEDMLAFAPPTDGEDVGTK